MLSLGGLIGATVHAQTYTVTDYSIAEADWNTPIAHAADDNLYIPRYHVSGSTQTISLLRLSTSGSATSVALSGSYSWTQTWQKDSISALLPGPDSQMWFLRNLQVGSNAGTYYLKTSTSGTVVTWTSGGAIGPSLTDRDGRVWTVSSSGFTRVGTDGSQLVVATGSNICSPSSLISGRDGNVWFTDICTTRNKVGYINPSGAVTTFSIPTASASPTALTLGPDGNYWFIEYGTQSPNKIGKVTPSGTLTEYNISSTNQYLTSITTGPDGHLFFTGNKSVLSVNSSGGFSEISLTGSSSSSEDPYPLYTTVGADARLWLVKQTGLNTISAIASSAVPTPTNDNFSSYATLSGTTGLLQTNNFNATAESGEPSNAGVAAQRTLWWRWTAPSTGEMTVATDGSSYDTVVGVYQGSVLTSLTPVTSRHTGGNGTSFATFYAQAGTTYDIVVDGYNGSRGQLLLNWSLVAASTDLALSITNPGGAYSGTNFNYQLSVSNQGPGYATNVTTTFTLPASVTYVSSSSACSYNSATRVVTCSTPLLTTTAGPQVYTVTVASSTTGSITASGNVSADGTDPNGSNNSPSFTTTVQPQLADVPTLPEWAALGLGAILMVGLGRMKLRNSYRAA